MTTLQHLEDLILHGSARVDSCGEHIEIRDALRMLAQEIDDLKTSLEEVSSIAKSAMPAFDTSQANERILIAEPKITVSCSKSYQ